MVWLREPGYLGIPYRVEAAKKSEKSDLLVLLRELAGFLRGGDFVAVGGSPVFGEL